MEGFLRMNIQIRQPLLVSGLLLASLLLLTIIQPPVGFSSLAWVALVPLILAATRLSSPFILAVSAYAWGVVYWLVSLYWLQPITTAGWVVFCLYMAFLWPLFGLALQWCHRRHWPLGPCVAILWMGAEQCQGLFLGGFYWRFLAHSQFQNLSVIQIADILGATGVTLVIAWTNGFTAELILTYQSKRKDFARLRKHALVTALLLAGTLGYGHWRLRQTPQYTRPGPRVGIIQSNIPQHVKETFQAAEEIMAELLIHSQACAKNGVDLIVWPETMIQSILDETVWPYLLNEDYIAQCRNQDNQLKEHALNTAYLLVGTYGGTIYIDDTGQIRLNNHNSANLFRPDGTRDPARYDKIKPILFGEYLPFENTWPWLHRRLLSLTPYNYDYTLDAGTEYTVFTMNSPASPLSDSNAVDPNIHRFGVIICYEGTLPQISQGFALDEKVQKQVDWLVNISNDGWFVRFDTESQTVTPSTELAQHVAACVFRAVENRLPILRSVNTGISCIITSTGALKHGFQEASEGFPPQPLDRQGMAGWFTDTIPLDSRITIFSRFGRWLDYVGMVCFGTVALFALLTIGKTARRIRLTRSAT